MKLYMAPLEGITGYIYRNTVNKYFGEGIDKFFTPFLVPHTKKGFSHKEINEISVEHNQGINLVPQILTNNAEDFTGLANKLRGAGYGEVNLNLGCPSRTVTSKGRGAGALEDVTKLDEFLKAIFAEGDENISVKTRIGVNDPEEFYEIIDIYSKYPIKELIIHPRVLKEMYNGRAHRDVFNKALESYKKPVCYNGDIFSVADYETAMKEIGGIDSANSTNIQSVMIGRGMLRNPALIREISGGKPASNDEIGAMLDEMRALYEIEMSGQTPVLFKMKELWSNLQSFFPGKEKLCKKLLKTKSLAELDIIAKQILSD